MSRLFILGILGLFSLSQLLHAEEIFDLQRIEIFARKDLSVFTFSSPSTLSTAELEFGPTGQLSSHFNDVPGVIANQNGGPGGRVSYFIRGTESRHVAYTLDGLKLNDPSNTDRQFDSAFFSAPFLKSVDIHKGPQSVLFGSDSMGGLIEMVSRKGDEAPATRVSFNGGSFGTIDTSISNDWKTQKGSKGTFTGYRFHSDSISRLNKKRFNATERDASDITQITSSSAHRWSSKVNSDFLFSYLRGENELDGTAKDNSYDQSTNDQYLFQQKTNLKLSSSEAISIRNGLNRHQRTIDSLSSGQSSFQGLLFQNEALYRREEKSNDLLVGLATEHEELKIKNLARNFDLHSIFSQGAFRFSDFKVHLGARVESHVQYGFFYTGSSGLAYAFKKHLLTLQYSQGYKAPSLYQLYAPPLLGNAIGNASLVPERNHSWEAGWKMGEDHFETGLVLFQNRLSNLITFTTGQGYVNQGVFIAEGVELSGKIKQRFIQFSSSFIMQEFKEENSVVLRRPLNSLLIGVAVFPTENSEVSVKNRWFSNRKDLDPSGNTIKLNGYEVMDVGIKYVLSELDLGIQVLNVLNRDYEELYGYSIMPRSVFGHIGFRY